MERGEVGIELFYAKEGAPQLEELLAQLLLAWDEGERDEAGREA